MTWQALPLQSTQAGGVENIRVFFDVVQEDATSMRESTSINGEMVDSYGSIAEVARLEDLVKRCDEALKPFQPAGKKTVKKRRG